MKVIFEGGGFPAFWYGIGYGSKLIKQINPCLIAGYSAGALVAAVLVCSDYTIDDLVELYSEASTFNKCGGISRFVTSMMENILPTDAHTRANDKLAIIVCDPNNNSKCKIISKWESCDELIKCLVASCYIPCMMECLRMTDERYDCRDAIFSTDLPDVLDCFNIVVHHTPYVGFDIGRLCQNLNVPSYDKTMSLVLDGERDCKLKINHANRCYKCLYKDINNKKIET